MLESRLTVQNPHSVNRGKQDPTRSDKIRQDPRVSNHYSRGFECNLVKAIKGWIGHPAKSLWPFHPVPPIPVSCYSVVKLILVAGYIFTSAEKEDYHYFMICVII